jgi:predicted nucleic acid-binding protein
MTYSNQDIKAHEAMTDWIGEKARYIRRLLDEMDASEDELREVEDDLKAYDDDDLSDEDAELARRLTRRLTQLL